MSGFLLLNTTSSNPRSGNSLLKINRSTIFAGLSFENSIIAQITPLSLKSLSDLVQKHPIRTEADMDKLRIFKYIRFDFIMFKGHRYADYMSQFALKEVVKKFPHLKVKIWTKVNHPNDRKYIVPGEVKLTWVMKMFMTY